MARPSKPLSVNSKHLTKSEIRSRQEQEDKLRGGSENLTPASYLTKEQIKRFRYYVRMMKASGIISDIDSANLSNMVFVESQLEKLNQDANSNPDKINDKQWLAARSQLTKELAKYTSEFCLSPTSRAKMGSNNIKKKEEEKDPLLNALRVVK